MRYFFLAILLALPDVSFAQIGIRAGRGTPAPAATAGSNDRSNEGSDARSNERPERTAVPKSNSRSNERSNGGSNVGSNEGSNVGSNDRQNHRQNDRRNDRQNDRQLPWWEQRQLPWWERQNPAAVQRQSQEEWERSLVNPSRAAIELNRKAREAERVQRRRAQPTVIYALPPYRYFYPNTTYGYGVESTTYITPAPPDVVAPPAPEVVTGFLRLEVEPRHLLQVFVDGLYIGTPADLGDEFELRLGARRVELRAPGYRTLIFDTEIVADRTIVYRGQLEPSASASGASTASGAPSAPRAPLAPAAPASRTIYMIPGCYIGNVAPTADMVRPGCDLSKLITRAPQ